MVKTIYICPRCLSPNVRKDIGLSVVLGIPQQWLCKDCGFKAHIFPNVGVEDYLKKRNKETKRKSSKALKAKNK